MATHVKVIAALYFVFAGLCLLGALFSSVVLTILAGVVSQSGEHDAQTGAAVLGVSAVMISTVLVLFAIPFIIAGWGLLKFRPWARIMGIVLGVLCLIHIPFGTMLGIYALVILFKKETEALFV